MKRGRENFFEFMREKSRIGFNFLSHPLYCSPLRIYLSLGVRLAGRWWWRRGQYNTAPSPSLLSLSLFLSLPYPLLTCLVAGGQLWLAVCTGWWSAPVKPPPTTSTSSPSSSLPFSLSLLHPNGGQGTPKHSGARQSPRGWAPPLRAARAPSAT